MIEVTHLTKRYGPHTAINNISFHVKKGEIVGFLGPNGAGKTTTMRVLTCSMPATEGSARVAGFDVFERPMDVKKNVGYLPETPPVYLEMRVSEYVQFAAKLHGVAKDKLNSAVSNAIEKTSLGQVKNRLIGNLSKGYRQRVGLAQALVHNPQVLILDEPTVGLDPKQIIEIRELIKGLAGDHTVILSSHILPEVTATCQRIIVIKKGTIVAQDTIESLTGHLNKGTLLSMTLKAPNPEGIDRLRKIEGVVQVSATGPKLVIEIKPNFGDLRDTLVTSAVQSQMGVLEFTSEKLSLEEVFLQLTTQEEGLT